MRYQFELNGITPLLMHADNVEAADEVTHAEKTVYKNATKGDDRSVPWKWQTYLYRNDSGDVCIPQENLLAMLVAAGAKIKNGRGSHKASATLIAFEELDFQLLVDGSPIVGEDIDAIGRDRSFEEQVAECRKLGFRIGVKRAAVSTSKHVRTRPEFRNWSIVGTFEVDDAEAKSFSTDTIQEMFTIAGKYIGLGDWRPGAKRPGRYGKFTASVTKA